MCAKYRFGKRCVESCDSLQGVYDAGGNTCKECDQECAVNCTGTVSDNTCHVTYSRVVCCCQDNRRVVSVNHDIHKCLQCSHVHQFDI